MNLSVQFWLMAIGALIIVGVLLDAYRRHRSESRNPIRMGRKPGFWKMGDGFREEGDAPNGELPNGGARVRDRPDDHERTGSGQTRADGRIEPSLDAVPIAAAPVMAAEPRVEAAVSAPARAGGRQQPAQPQPAPVPARSDAGDNEGEVLVIHVLARAPEEFAGEGLARLFQACDVRFGAMSIFHRHEEEKGMGAVQFSVANVTHPGTFDDATLDGVSSPGLSFFLRLPGPQRPLEAFDCMLETARVVARKLDGEMQDESHSVFTSQTAEHYRQRVREHVHHTSRPRR